MKKIWSLFFSLLVTASASALPVGNPWDASLLLDGVIMDGHCFEYPSCNWCEAWSVRVGFYGDYVYDRHLRVDEKENHSTIHKSEVYTNAGYLALNLFDRVDLFGTVGATRISLSGPQNEFDSIFSSFFFLESMTDFSWSIGVRGTLWECGCFGLGAEAQYFYTKPRLNWALNDQTITNPVYGDSGNHVKYQEWQIGIGAAYQYFIATYCSSLVPYVAVKWSQAKVDLGNFPFDDFTFPDLENDRSFGYAVGVTLVGAKKMSVTIEGRFIDERAVHVNTQYRF